jgi:hypothetical protein
MNQPGAIDEFNCSLRRDIYAIAAANATKKTPKHHTTHRILPGRVPDESPVFEPRQSHVHPQDIVDFMVWSCMIMIVCFLISSHPPLFDVCVVILHIMVCTLLLLCALQFKKQDENKATYRLERKQARDKANSKSLVAYEPPASLYTPPVQFYDKNRPYFQEYIKYRNELKPVVMPTFTQVKGSVRDLAKSSFMPVKDPNKVSKRDELFEQRVRKLREEERDGEKIKTMLRTKKQKEKTHRRRIEAEQRQRQMHVLASPIKSSKPSTGFASHRSPAPPSSSRPGTCNSFSPAALRTAYDRPDYPTAGTIWITDV